MASQRSRPGFLLFSLSNGTLDSTPVPVEPDSYVNLGVLELQHLEKWLVERPEVLGEELLIVTRQFSGFDKTKERSDILGLDRAGRLVIVELKRDDSGARQDLQALRYAASSANLTLEQVRDLYIAHRAKAGETVSQDEAAKRFKEHVVEGSLDGFDEDNKPRIVLVAKAFQWEVASTCLWLRDAFGMDISCVQLVPYSVNGQVLLASSVLIPLPEASKYTAQREEKRKRAEASSKVDWSKAMDVMAAIPEGRWMSYQDLAVAAGGTPRAGMAVGQYLAKTTELSDSVHRVLRGDGTVSPGWEGEIGGAEECMALLKQEGITFDDKGRADQTQRWAPSPA